MTTAVTTTTTTPDNVSPARDAYAEYMRMASRISPRPAGLESVVFVGAANTGKSSLIEYLASGGGQRSETSSPRKTLVTQDEQHVMIGDQAVALVYVTGNPALAELATEQLQTCRVAVLVFDLGRSSETIEPLLTYADALARGRRIDGSQPAIILCANKADQMGGGGQSVYDNRLWRNRLEAKDEWVLNFFELRFSHVQLIETQCVGAQAYHRVMKLRDLISSHMPLPPLAAMVAMTTRSYGTSTGTILTTRSAPTPRHPDDLESGNDEDESAIVPPPPSSESSTSYEVIVMDEFGHQAVQERRTKTPSPAPVTRDWRKSAPAVLGSKVSPRKRRSDKCGIQ